MFIFTFYYKYLKYEKKYLLFRKQNGFVVCNRINGFVVVLNRKAEQPTTNGANKMLVLHVRLRCGSLSVTKPVSFLANKFDVRSVLHGQVSLAAINQIHVIHGAMNGCKNLKIH